MPRKKKPDAYDYDSYAGLSSIEMIRRARAAGCQTMKEVGEWIDRSYGATSDREENHIEAPMPWRWKPESR